MKMVKMLAALLALGLCMGLALPVGASYTYTTPNRQIIEWEDATYEENMERVFSQGSLYEKREIYNPYTMPEKVTYKNYKVNDGYPNGNDLITRGCGDSFKFTEPSETYVVADLISLTVSRDCTLTFGKDITVTVNGQIFVAKNATLVNEGTMVLRSVPMEGTHMSNYESTLKNSGKIVNHGTIIVESGQINNLSNFENRGTIIVKNAEQDKASLRNGAKPEGKDDKNRRFVNTGNIRLQNTAGYGLENVKGSVFANSGTIAKTEGAVVIGEITGNQPGVKANP